VGEPGRQASVDAREAQVSGAMDERDITNERMAGVECSGAGEPSLRGAGWRSERGHPGEPTLAPPLLVLTV
jgi:hypothetical protein